jgi:hypothetical protein
MKRLLKFLDQNRSREEMNIEFIEAKLQEIYAELEKEVMVVLMDESFDRKQTNLRVQPLKSTKKILENALDSIKMVEKLAKEDLEK